MEVLHYHTFLCSRKEFSVSGFTKHSATLSMLVFVWPVEDGATEASKALQ